MNELRGAAKNLKKEKSRKHSTMQRRQSGSQSPSKTDSQDDISVDSENNNQEQQLRLTVVPVQELVLNTTLVFVELNGLKKEIQLTKRLLTYSELQREIAHKFPRNRDMYVIQNTEGEKVLPTNFAPADRLIVRKILTKPPSEEMFKTLSNYWETNDYHDAIYNREKEKK
jgi:hypothetical protein